MVLFAEKGEESTRPQKTIRDCLVDDTSRGVAEDGLAEDGQDTAAGALAAGGAGGLELGGLGEDSAGLDAVEVGDAQDISGTAQRGVVETRARVVDLAGLHGRGRDGGGGEEGGDDEGGLHLD